MDEERSRAGCVESTAEDLELPGDLGRQRNSNCLSEVTPLLLELLFRTMVIESRMDKILGDPPSTCSVTPELGRSDVNLVPPKVEDYVSSDLRTRNVRLVETRLERFEEVPCFHVK